MDTDLNLYGYQVSLVNLSVGAAFRRLAEDESKKVAGTSQPVWEIHRSLVWTIGFPRWYFTATLHYAKIEDIYESNSLTYSYDVKFSANSPEPTARSKIHWFPYLPWIDLELAPPTCFGAGLTDDIRSSLILISAKSSPESLLHSKDALRYLCTIPMTSIVFAVFSDGESADHSGLLKALHEVLSSKVVATPLSWISKKEKVDDPSFSASSPGFRLRIFDEVVYPNKQGQADLIFLIGSVISLPAKERGSHSHHHCRMM